MYVHMVCACRQACEIVCASIVHVDAHQCKRLQYAMQCKEYMWK